METGYNPGVQADWRGIGTTDVVITLSGPASATAKGLTLEGPSIPYSATRRGRVRRKFTVDLTDIGG